MHQPLLCHTYSPSILAWHGCVRQRRGQQRAAARNASTAENALNVAGKKAEEAIDLVKDNQNEQETLEDEFCPNDTFNADDVSSLDKEKIENPVDEILLIFIDTVDQKKEVIEKNIEEKLLSVGIAGIERIDSIENEHGKWKVKVKIKPIGKDKIEAASYPLCVF